MTRKLVALLIALTFACLCMTGCFGSLSVFEDEASFDSQPESTSSPSAFDSIDENDFTDLVIEQRDYRVQPKGNGEDTVTLMLYLCGSDLESQGGAATSDLMEIMEASISDQVNIVVETGGALEWQNDLMDPDTNERWLITDEGIAFLQDAGPQDMSLGDTLADFIRYSSETFPADRYMLVLWDHGGGTVDGYAYDERFGNDEMMPIAELNQALSDAGVIFDMIGFDCCLMSTAETAYMVEKYADYMVASQRVEPGNGWHYTPWIDALSQNTSIPTRDLGKIIVDSFIEASADGFYGSELTLAVTDLTYIPQLFEGLNEFFSQAQPKLLSGDNFISTSRALGSNRAADDNYDLIDLAYLISSMEGSQELLYRLSQCVAYNGTTIDHYNGLCLYFPYTDLSKVDDAMEIYNQIGIDTAYQEFITSFASVMVGGQVYNQGGTGNPFDLEGFDLSSWLDEDWLDEDLISDYEWFYEENCYDGSELFIEEKGDEFVLSLSDEDWELITAIEQRVFLDDGEGFIDLGADSMYEFDEDGDLLINFDNTWVALDGELVCFYTIEDYYEDDDNWYSYGAVPVLYEGKDAQIIVMWDAQNPYGYVAGWRYTATGSSSQKGLFEMTDGMRFDFLCDYYTYDGEYDDQYLWGDITVNGPIEVSYEDVGSGDCLVYYELYDVYGNSYWTESVIYYS